MSDKKEIRWVGSACDDLLSFPDEPRRYAGFQLGKVQVGLDPDDWKAFDDVGVGTREIRIRETSSIYRVMYVAKFEEAVYVFTASKRRRRRPVSRTRALPRRATAPWSTRERYRNEDRH